MSDIPDEAVEVATQLFWDEVLGRSDKWEQFAKDNPEEAEIIRDNRRYILEAAAPRIRADERQRIAEEIRAYIAEYRHAYALPGNPYAEGFTTGLEAFSEAHLTERNGK